MLLITRIIKHELHEVINADGQFVIISVMTIINTTQVKYFLNIYSFFNSVWHNIYIFTVKNLKQVLLLFFILNISIVKAQQIDSIYVHLYTDSLKKGTYNYINIDGRLTNGNYLPLDNSQLTFSSSSGEFKGNSLWIDKDSKYDKVRIKVVLKTNPSQHKEFDMYIKQKPDNENLKTVEEILNESKQSNKNKKTKS